MTPRTDFLPNILAADHQQPRTALDAFKPRFIYPLIIGKDILRINVLARDKRRPFPKCTQLSRPQKLRKEVQREDASHTY